MTEQLIRAASRDERPRSADAALRRRAAAVIPGGMYGHQSAGPLPPEYPQFMRSGRGARIWDVDGNEYLDLMCSYGPVVLGHQHPAVERAARQQAELADCQNGPGAVMVELAELLVDTVEHADWAMFAKNGTDATTTCVTIARAQTGRDRILVATGAYHGAAPWCTPRPAGVTAADRVNIGHYTFNDLPSVLAAAQAGPELAAIVVSPFKHDAGFDQELVDPAFARGLRELCDRTGAALILDDVRCGFRLQLGSSWEPVGVLAGPVGLEQGDRQRPSARSRAGIGPVPRRRRQHLRDRFILVLSGGDGRRDRNYRRAAGGGRRRDDGPDRQCACGPGSSTRPLPMACRSATPGRRRCRT